MTAKTCGDFGGRTKVGAPCKVRRRKGRCAKHRQDGPSDTVRRQREGRQTAFLAAYAKTGNITVAANKAGINRGTHYEWVESDPDYAERFQDAGEEAADYLEAEARRRAVVGVEEPVGWYKGEPGGTVRKYSDTLLIFLLKGLRPEKFRERHSHEHSGPDGGPVEVRQLSDDELVERSRKLANRVAATSEAHRGNGRR